MTRTEPQTAHSRGMDDNALMLLARNGREEAFRELVTRYRNRIVNHIYRMVGDYERAVDIAQEVFLRIHRSIESYDVSQKFSTWIYHIATNLAIDELRKRKRRGGDHIPIPASSGNYEEGEPCWTPEDPDDPEAALLRRETAAKVEEALRGLDREQLQIFLLKEVEQFPLEEISRITGVKIGTLKSRLHRMRATLVERLRPHVGGLA